MSYNSTCVLVLKDFAIHSLPTMPLLYTNRIDFNVWKEFTDQISQGMNQTYCQSHNITNLASIRCRLQAAYWVFAPLTCILGYAAYYTFALEGVFGTGVFVVALILALGAFASLITAISTAMQCGKLMREYRCASQQDLNRTFNYMNQRYNNAIYFSAARSTHRNNGNVQLGITVALRAQHINTDMTMHDTVAPCANVNAPPFQMQGVVVVNRPNIPQIVEPLQQPLMNDKNDKNCSEGGVGEGEEGVPAATNNNYTVQ